MIQVNKKQKAFSLAELLLAMTIVGVISALTVPSLKHHADETKYVAATQKAMSEVVALTGAIELQKGEASTWGKFNDGIKKEYENQANTVPLPKFDGKSYYATKILSGEKWTDWFTPDFMTADGMLWVVGDGGYPCGGGVAIIDVNGTQPPNTVGIDIQGFRIGHLCGIDNSKIGDFGIYAMGDGVNDKNSAWACTSYIIKHKKMPWLYTPTTSCSGYMGK